MSLDVTRVLAAEPLRTELVWEPRDVLLYHLGLGAGRRATSPAELPYVLESRLRVLPSFATVAGGHMASMAALSAPGVDVDLAAVLHAGQRLELHRPVPASGRARLDTRVLEVHDKGRAAVLVVRSEATDREGPLWTATAQLYVRGEGGFGGERGTARRHVPPERDPDLVVDYPVAENQALLYRLSGDLNPLHADPGFARLAGFPRPVLHGLCTYGMALRAVVDGLLDGDTERVLSLDARFAGVVYPGETLRLRMWRGSGDLDAGSTRGEQFSLTAEVVERAGELALTDGLVRCRPRD
ncbi:MaoC/PaaZ C-terminal domain-containing protein [Streptomyces sp. NPDC005438]|uniref:MaoC/PaaZ C-terminal domain-containing protein n=1 Tax=Streptomyces sp. NPDC005438 TaxID=3156880 RepID=UPI0033A45182